MEFDHLLAPAQKGSGASLEDVATALHQESTKARTPQTSDQERPGTPGLSFVLHPEKSPNINPVDLLPSGDPITLLVQETDFCLGETADPLQYEDPSKKPLYASFISDHCIDYNDKLDNDLDNDTVQQEQQPQMNRIERYFPSTDEIIPLQSQAEGYILALWQWFQNLANLPTACENGATPTSPSSSAGSLSSTTGGSPAVAALPASPPHQQSGDSFTGTLLATPSM
jgi:hypothetical protein